MTTRDTVVTERWGAHYWSCTWCAAVQAVRHVRTPRHGPPATQAEVRALAAAGGDANLADGSRLSHLVRAVRVRYGLTWHAEPALELQRFRQLADTTGVGLVLGVTASRMPAAVRRHYGRFGGGHRTFVAAYGDRDALHRRLVTVLDPMMPEGYAGVRVRPDELWPAVWRAEAILVHAPRELPEPPRPPAVALKYHGVRYGPRSVKVKADATRVRTSPYVRADNIARTLAAGAVLRVYQRTTQGTRTAGSSTWYGTQDGLAWVHASVVTVL